MAMFSTKSRRLTLLAGVLGVAGGLCGCVESQRTLSDDFGRALHENLVAQITDPEPHYKGDPAPGSSGNRVGLAQKRYVSGAVIKPVPATASKIGATDSGGDNGNGPSGPGQGGSPP